jgi:adenosylcobyric acid synthase
MVQGTTSHAGKSVLATALCRIFAQDGFRVCPFKAQNMSNNAFVTMEGGEIGRAQAVQAEAAGVAPTVDMNPVLLKPEAERRSQIVVLGKAEGSADAREYYTMKPRLWPVVTGALDRLREAFDVVVIEGAGSPAEINLKEQEIVNMSVARYAQAPVLLVADIDRGGVFASLVGTMELLEPEERALVEGFVINKFRGDLSLLDPGLDMLTQRTGTPVVGVLPYFTDVHIPQEDSLGLDSEADAGEGWILDVAVVRLPHLANFDDMDPLKREAGVRLRYVADVRDFGAPDLVIVPGSKTTMDDLAWMKQRRLDGAIAALRAKGTPVIGICGGYQMLGGRILDPNGLESSAREIEGLGLLRHETVFEAAKATEQVEALVAGARGMLARCAGAHLRGYEIHMGRTSGQVEGAPLRVVRRSGAAVSDWDGALDESGLTMGTYVHGLFHNDVFRRALLEELASWKGAQLPPPDSSTVDGEYDKLAALVREHLDLGLVYRSMGLGAGAR